MKLKSPLKIAIAGLGTVGVGLIRQLNANGPLLEKRCGRKIQIVAVSARNRTQDRGIDIQKFKWFENPEMMAECADVEVIVELIGGQNGVAKSICEKSLATGKSVVTANKALLAHHGSFLANYAEKKNLSLAYEAAVAGGIPIIKTLREGLAGNKVISLYGILNGTSNYILTAMRNTSRVFNEVLAEAQSMGFAEADPSFDVDGIDSAHKLAILSSVSFGCKINFKDVYVEGIRYISPLDLILAEELGYRIKLLGIAHLKEEGIEQRVHPCMVSLDSPITHVEGVQNAVVVDCDGAGSTIYEGMGAGGGPTASALISDLVDIARNIKTPTFGLPINKLKSLPTVQMDKHVGAYYIRLMVVDKPGVFAEVASILRDEAVSMEAILQKTHAPGNLVPLVMTTHEVEEGALKRVLKKFEALETVLEKPRMIRIEPLN